MIRPRSRPGGAPAAAPAVSCDDCGQPVSRSALDCPHCGYPVGQKARLLRCRHCEVDVVPVRVPRSPVSLCPRCDRPVKGEQLQRAFLAVWLAIVIGPTLLAAGVVVMTVVAILAALLGIGATSAG